MQRPFICLVASAFLAAIGLTMWMSNSVGLTSQVKLTKTNVDAPRERLFALIDDFRKWGMWSPHEKEDPAVRRTYSDPPKGKGAAYEWDGSENIGAGRAQIAESDAPAKIIVDLDLTRPVRGHLALDFTLERTGTATKIEVSTNGPDDLVKYVMNVFFAGSLMRLSCAADGSPKPICRIIMQEPAHQP